jgi:uncharacterized RDD family membrane protein YckC
MPDEPREPEAPGPAGAPDETPSAEPPPPVGWAAMAPAPKVEVAPGIVYASTARRFVAYVIDSLITGIVGYLIAIAIIAALGSERTDLIVQGLTVGIMFCAISFAYFVWGWTSGARATPGMRLLRLQVGNASDGRTLTLDQAVRRWIALGDLLAIASAIPALSDLSVLASLGLYIVLLLTTVASPTKQGLHDRFAGSAVVEPVGLSSTGPVVGCIVLLVVVFVILPAIALAALIFLGGEVSTILSAVGSPLP